MAGGSVTGVEQKRRVQAKAAGVVDRGSDRRAGPADADLPHPLDPQRVGLVVGLGEEVGVDVDDVGV